MRSLIERIAADWRNTKMHCSDIRKTLRNYRYFRARGFTRRASWFNASNVL